MRFSGVTHCLTRGNHPFFGFPTPSTKIPVSFWLILFCFYDPQDAFRWKKSPPFPSLADGRGGAVGRILCGPCAGRECLLGCEWLRGWARRCGHLERHQWDDLVGCRHGHHRDWHGDARRFHLLEQFHRLLRGDGGRSGFRQQRHGRGPRFSDHRLRHRRCRQHTDAGRSDGCVRSSHLGLARAVGSAFHSARGHLGLREDRRWHFGAR